MSLLLFIFTMLGVSQFMSFKYREHLVKNCLQSKGLVFDSATLPNLDKPTIKIIRRRFLLHALIPLAYTVIIIAPLTSVIDTPEAHSENRFFYQYLILSTIITMFLFANLALSTLTVTSKSKIAGETSVFIVSLLYTLLYSIYCFFVALGFANMKWG